ncbi:MAG TPA: hypothetical protein VI893_09835 [Thermoplasmata archaeon]|nr:hypothetical protein [Thermoplasmata archaeon]
MTIFIYVFVSNPGFRQDLWLLYLWPAFFLMLMAGVYLIRYSRRLRRKVDGGAYPVPIQD